MTQPGTTDSYYTHTKTKYISGLVKTAHVSVATAGQHTVYSTGSLKCSAALEIIDSAGTTYYIPLYAVSNK